MLQDYEIRDARRKEVVKHPRSLAERLHDTISKKNLKPILDEIATQINENTLDRMAAFGRTLRSPKCPTPRISAGCERTAARRRFGHR